MHVYMYVYNTYKYLCLYIYLYIDLTVIELAYVFQRSVSMRKVASEHPFCVLIHMNSYIFHIYLI